LFSLGARRRQNMNTPETTKPPHFCEGFVLYGAGTRSRTRDLLITSPKKVPVFIGEHVKALYFQGYMGNRVPMFPLGVDTLWTLFCLSLHAPSKPFTVCSRPHFRFRCDPAGLELRLHAQESFTKKLGGPRRREGEKCIFRR